MSPEGEGRRPNPDLLDKLFADEARDKRGHLRLYVGAAPGVGKTYAMLHEGQRRRSRGTDVVVGFVETHDRLHTIEALEGLEVVPRRKVVYQGAELEEMDTDAVIARRPKVALIDELAHTNAPGSKHERRYQDVQEILAAGIDVVGTLNIQHLESLNDVVAGITGIRVRETVPDWVVDRADEVDVVDISPEALRARMRHGNIYPPEQAERALERFFRPGNLSALRELALRRVLGGVEQRLGQDRAMRRREGGEPRERVCVLLDHTPASEVAVRRAARLAQAFSADLFAAYARAEAREPGMTHILTAAIEFNATLEELPGADLEAELDALLREERIGHVTLIRDPPKRLSLHMQPALADRLLLRQPDLDVHLVARQGDIH